MMKLKINGQDHEVDASPDMPLLWLLRDHFNLTGTKFGCGLAQCGACTVHLDGEAAPSCVTRLGDIAGREVITIEAITGSIAAAVTTAWQNLNVVQCGYCQSGQIMAAIALLTRNARPTDADIDAAMDNNLCRCGTYGRVRQAIHAAARAAGQRGQP